MKKKITLLFSIITMLCLLAFPLNAAGEVAETSSANAKPGDTVTITISLTAENVTSGGIQFTYDTTALDIVEGSLSISGMAIANWDNDKEKAGFLSMSGPVNVSGVIFTAKVKVLETATPGKKEFKAEVQLNDRSVVLNPVGYITIECNHSFTATTVAAEYLKSEATCSSKAVYYKSCAICGEKGTETFETGETAPHTYDQKVTTDTFLASKADCVNKAKYYYSCKCGAKGTTTYEVGETASHSYTKKIETADYLKNEADCENAKTYYYACSGCDAKGTETYTVGEKLGHTGGTATCTKKAVCTRCNKEYGDLLAHTYSEKVEDAKYLKNEASCTSPKTYYCSCTCGAKGTETFTVGEKTDHSFTEKTETYKYLATSGSCTKKATYYYSCECGEKGTETFESRFATGHSYKEEWQTDAEGHWHVCSKCYDIKDNADHVPGPAATEKDPQTCTVCGYVIKAALGHTHKYGTELKYDGTNHYLECTCGQKKDVEAHVFDNACDPTCNKCAYTREVEHELGAWVTDANNHWHECAKCHEKFDSATHTPGAEATEKDPQTCTVCGYVIKEAIGHTHSYTHKHDENNHWDECACGTKENLEAHKFDEGTVQVEPTEDKEGSKVYKCECGYEKVEKLAKLEPTGPSILVFILIGLGVLVLVGGVTAGIIIYKKRKNQE